MKPEFALITPTADQLHDENSNAWEIYQSLPDAVMIKETLAEAKVRFPGFNELMWEIGLASIQEITELGFVLIREQLCKFDTQGLSYSASAEYEQSNKTQNYLLAYYAWMGEAIVNYIGFKKRRDTSFSHSAEATTIESLIKWITALCDTSNWHGDPPFYIFITDPNFPTDLHQLERTDENDHADWASGFDQRLVVPYRDRLSPQQKDEMWSYLLIEQGIYESDFSDESRRKSVFRSVKKLLPNDTHRLIDIAGGKGDLVKYLYEQGVKAECVIVDNAASAVNYAQKLGLIAYHYDLEKELPSTLGTFDVATITFSIQWLSPAVIQHVYDSLESGGTIICNIYKPNEKKNKYYIRQFGTIGFTDINIVMADNQIDPILVAHKPKK